MYPLFCSTAVAFRNERMTGARCRCVFAQLTLVFVTLFLTNHSVRAPPTAFETTGSRILIEVLISQVFTKESTFFHFSPEICLLLFFVCLFSNLKTIFEKDMDQTNPISQWVSLETKQV